MVSYGIFSEVSVAKEACSTELNLQSPLLGKALI